MSREFYIAFAVALVVVAAVSALTAPLLGVLAGFVAMLGTALVIDVVRNRHDA